MSRLVSTSLARNFQFIPLVSYLLVISLAQLYAPLPFALLGRFDYYIALLFIPTVSALGVVC